MTDDHHDNRYEDGEPNRRFSDYEDWDPIGEGYALTDPKHPDYFSTLTDWADGEKSRRKEAFA